jgi:hypothetical protein
MKNPLFIILTILGTLGAIACTVLIVLILMNSRSHRDSSTEPPIPIPERFKALPDSTSAAVTADSATVHDAQGATSNDPAYTGSLSCGVMISAEKLGRLLSERNLYCQKSTWSNRWANPTGRGIHAGQAGLFYSDSVVTDSLTRLMWQRYELSPGVTYKNLDAAVARLNTANWQGYANWRTPTVEELMALLRPAKNSHGLYMPEPWACRSSDLWSCSPAADSGSVKWIWVVRAAFGRCNYGHPDMPRALLAVREY